MPAFFILSCGIAGLYYQELFCNIMTVIVPKAQVDLVVGDYVFGSGHTASPRTPQLVHIQASRNVS